MSAPRPARPSRAIVIAAGLGSRLAPYTDEMPKCLVPLGGRPMLLAQLEALRAQGVDDVVLIRGYCAEVLGARVHELGPGVRFVDNRDFRDNNILQSLFMAESALEGPLYTTYGDIVYSPAVAAALAAAAGDICLVVDRGFRRIYEGRSEHPLEEAEVCVVEGERITQVGKRAVAPAQAWGEFIGLAKWSARGAAAMCAAYRAAQARYSGRAGDRFHRNSWQKAYLTDLIEELIHQGHAVVPVAIDGGWREIDTVQDLQRAESAWSWHTPARIV